MSQTRGWDCRHPGNYDDGKFIDSTTHQYYSGLGFCRPAIQLIVLNQRVSSTPSQFITTLPSPHLQTPENTSPTPRSNSKVHLKFISTFTEPSAQKNLPLTSVIERMSLQWPLEMCSRSSTRCDTALHLELLNHWKTPGWPV